MSRWDDEKPHRAELHTSPHIQFSLCDGCSCMSVKKPDYRLERLGRGEWSYYCAKLGRHLSRKEVCEMTSSACPVYRDPYRNRRFKS